MSKEERAHCTSIMIASPLLPEGVVFKWDGCLLAKETESRKEYHANTCIWAKEWKGTETSAWAVVIGSRKGIVPDTWGGVEREVVMVQGWERLSIGWWGWRACEEREAQRKVLRPLLVSGNEAAFPQMVKHNTSYRGWTLIVGPNIWRGHMGNDWIRLDPGGRGENDDVAEVLIVQRWL